MCSANGRIKINDNNNPKYIFNGNETIKIFICGIIFEVNPHKISVINRIPKIGNATIKPSEKI